MGYSLAELESMLEDVKTAISKCLTAQEYSAGAGLSVRRAMLGDLMSREKWLLSEIAAAGGSAGDGCDPANRVTFVNPS